MTIQDIKQRYGIIGNAPLLDRAIDIAKQVAPTDLSVLITGESGTGKEVFPQIKKEMKGKIIEDIADNISKLIMAYGRRDKKDYRINFERMGKKEHLFHKKGTALTVNMDHPEGRLNKKKMDRFLLAAILVLENIVSHEDIEMILQEVTRTQKEIKQHG